MTKVLFYGEHPSISTGLSQVSRHHIELFQRLGYEIETCCINHYARGSYPCEPYKVNPSVGDGMNRDNARRLIRACDYDLLFFSCDIGNINCFLPDIIAAKLKKKMKVVAYTCVDCDHMQADVFSFASLCDYIGVYSEHSKEAISRIAPGVEVRVIHLGCEPDFFFPVDKTEKKRLKSKYFGNVGRVVINVNRNQWRKDIARGMYAFHEFWKQNRDSVLYLHCKKKDVGGDLPYIALGLGIPPETLMFTDDTFDERVGSSREILRELYQAADLFFSSSTGEGWGLTTTDAMASGLPVLVPGNTANIDLVGRDEERGSLIACGGLENWYLPYESSANMRDMISVESAIKKLWLCFDKDQTAKIQAAREWTESHTWGHHLEKWQEELERIMA